MGIRRRKSLVYLLALGAMGAGVPAAAARRKIRVLAWSERTEPPEIYPQGINGALVEMLNRQKGIEARATGIADPDQGVSESDLSATDVLIWFGHRHHKAISDESVGRIVRHVERRGMGYIALHSSHYALPFQRIVGILAERRGTPLEGAIGRWGRVRNEGRLERIHVLLPKHPIAKGIDDFTIPRTETYWNPFNVAPPDAKIFEGKYEGAQQDGEDGLLWSFGKGKMFYFRPGHETYPIYFQPEVQQVLTNAVLFLARGK